MATTIAGATAAWLVLWSFLSGGVLDRYARMRPTRAPGFFAACGTHFWRFLRLGLLAWLVYWVLFTLVHPWLFDDVYPWATRDMTAERSAFAVRAALLPGLRDAADRLQPGLRLRAHPHRRRGSPQRHRRARRRRAVRAPASGDAAALSAQRRLLRPARRWSMPSSRRARRRARRSGSRWRSARSTSCCGTT